MLSHIANRFDPLGIGSPRLLGGKLILQKTSSVGILWDEKLPASISERWRNWLLSLDSFCEFKIPHNYFRNVDIPMDNVSYQLHGFYNSSSLAFACVLYRVFQKYIYTHYIHLLKEFVITRRQEQFRDAEFYF